MNDKKNKPRTDEEWLADAPAEIREDLNFARNEKARQKAEIIGKLIANVGDDDKSTQIERLQKRSIEDLNADLALLPEPEEKPTTNYFGASVPVSEPVANFDDQEDLLPLPIMDYAEKVS